MVKILKNKSCATRFQILVEIARSGPNIQQRAIATRLELTPQAVSEYIGHLIHDKQIYSTGRSKYRLTNEGVDWILKNLRDLSNYTDQVARVINNIAVSSAIAETTIKKNQQVYLRMEEGLLIATTKDKGQAKGISINEAKTGEDVGVANIDGLIELERGRITILSIPSGREGGSAGANLPRLKELLGGENTVGAIGIEALGALRKVGIEPRYFYAVVEVAADLARHGRSIVVVAAKNETTDLITRLEEEQIEYSLVDLYR